MLVNFFSLALAGTILQDTDPVVTQEAIDYINSSQSSWVASSEWIGDMTVAEAKQYVGSILKPSSAPVKNWGALLDYTKVPDHFDSRTQWPSCVNEILDQGQCGSCWAFGAIEAFGDRICIETGKKITLSAQYVVDCDYGSYGCQGGYLFDVWSFLTYSGTTSDTCVPYKATDQSCPGSCSNGGSIELYKAKEVHAYRGPSSMQMAIMEGGPIETCFTVYQDFMSYKSGIYVHTSGSELGGHCVKPIGWGIQGGVKYWIIANSWGDSWGLSGYFWIEFGQCGIDDEAEAGKYSN